MGKEPGRALAKLDAYSGDKFNVLHPVTVTRDEEVISPVLVQAVSIVQADPRPEGPDVYVAWWADRQDPRKLAPSAHLLHRIGTAAGLRWQKPDFHGGPKRDPVTGHKSVLVTATAEARLPNGEWVGISKTKSIDTADLEEKWRAEEAKKNEERRAGKRQGKPLSEDFIETKIRTRILQMKDKIVEEAETKAMNRVLRSLLGIQQSYSVQDLRKPFAVPQLLYRPEAAAAIEAGRQATDELYEPGTGGALGRKALSSSSSAEEPSSDESSGEPAGGATGQTGGAGVDTQQSAPEAEATTAGPELKEPKDDPIITDEGPHKGERMSRIAEVDPGYLRGMAVHGRTKVLRELAQAWLDYATPTQQALEG